MKRHFISELFKNPINTLVFDKRDISPLNFDQMQEFTSFVYLLEQTLYKKIDKVIYKERGFKYSLILDDEQYEIKLSENNIMINVAAIIYIQNKEDEDSEPSFISLIFDWNLKLLKLNVSSNSVDFSFSYDK